MAHGACAFPDPVLDDFYRQLQPLLQSRSLDYLLAGLFVVIWFVASRLVGAVRRRRDETEPRPRRRLPLERR